MTSGTNRWTKWWWLRLDQMIGWSTDEWNAFAALMIVWIAQAAFFASMGLGLAFKFLSLSVAGSFFLSFLVALIICLAGVRQLTASLFRNTMMKGDDAAAARLGGKVYLPTNEAWIKATWWIDTWLIGKEDTRTKAKRQLMLPSCIVFMLFFPLLASVLIYYGFTEQAATLIGLVVVGPIALYAGRQIALQVRPELIKQADSDAIAAANDSVPPHA